MALIDFVRWEPGSSPVYAWKFPDSDNLSTMTQLVVAESQEAVLFSKGQLIGKFGPGKHTLNTENLPLLRNLFGLPFGGNNPFTAEVWFVNKLLPLNIDWATDAMMYHDPDYQTMVPLVAAGRYGLRVDDAERFLIKLVGTAHEFTAAQLTDNFRGALVARTKTVLLQFMQGHRIGIKSISAQLEPLSESLRTSMKGFWEEYGMSLIGFYVTSVDVDASSPVGQRILEAMSRQSAQAIGGYTWQQSQAFEVADKAVDAMGQGNGGGILGAVMMTSMINQGGMGGALMQPAERTGNAGQPPAFVPAPREVFCSNCSKKFQTTNKFCPHCGDPYRPCPKCGADNDSGARRCTSCGSGLADAQAYASQSGCEKCGAPLEPRAAFCTQCGQRVTS